MWISNLWQSDCVGSRQRCINYYQLLRTLWGGRPSVAPRSTTYCRRSQDVNIVHTLLVEFVDLYCTESDRNWSRCVAAGGSRTGPHLFSLNLMFPLWVFVMCSLKSVHITLYLHSLLAHGRSTKSKGEKNDQVSKIWQEKCLTGPWSMKLCEERIKSADPP